MSRLFTGCTRPKEISDHFPIDSVLCHDKGGLLDLPWVHHHASCSGLSQECRHTLIMFCFLSLCHKPVIYSPCAMRVRRRAKLSPAIMAPYLASSGAISTRYLEQHAMRGVPCYYSKYSIVLVSDGGCYIRRGSSIRQQSLDIITKETHNGQDCRRKGHGFDIMARAVQDLVSTCSATCLKYKGRGATTEAMAL